ncbi:MAG: C40 family peptidase [Clostridium sp.]|nr:C40 family peptidase [Clostridium sp.]
MNFSKKLYMILVLTLLITSIDKIVSADPLEKQLQDHNQSIEENSKKLEEYEIQEENLILDIQNLDNEITEAINKRSSLEKEISTTNSLIEDSTIKIDEYTNEIAKREDNKDAYVKNMYKYGDMSYLDIIFKSDNVFDAAYCLYNYSKLISANKENIEKLDILKEDLILEKEALSINKAELEKSKEEVNTLVEELNTMMSEQKLKLDELNSVQANLQEKIAKERTEVIVIQALLEEQRIKVEEEQNEASRNGESLNNDSTLNSNTSNSEDSNSSTSITKLSSYDIVAYASKFQGVPYVWGGTTPKGFDCSGLVQYCYAQFGYNLPRVSQDQQNYGTDVSLSDLKTGDLVFWGRPATHVAFYIDGGYILHAPYTGEVVRIQKVNLSNITSAKRIIN